MIHAHHNHCAHELKFCDKCNRPYCTKCDKEWFEQKWNWYPQYTAPATGYTQTTTGNYSVWPLKEMVQSDPPQTTCAHS